LKNKSYTKNYLKTYLWQGVAIILNLASMFVVVPMITSNKMVYGVYSICISTAMFLSYADLGFVSAGIKYAGESFAKGDHKNELKYYGFSGFILFIFITLVAAVYLLFSLNPSFIIKDISESEYLSIASSLLFIQAVFSFNTVLQRFVTGVFQVRIDQYVYQRINIVGSLIKISSVFYFFSPGNYDIVGYFLFIKIVELLTLIVGVSIIRTKYKLSITKYIRAFKFDREVFQKTKGLAFSSLFVTFMWILYYELDIIAIGKLLGATAVAIFALAFTFMKFLRSLSSIIFGPFQNRFNHLVGLDDMNGLKNLLQKVILFTMPIFILLILSIIMLNKNIVLSWAGADYLSSGIILVLLAINFMYSFIVIPGSTILVALVRIKEMYLINFVLVIVFWSGVFLTKNQIGVNSFALFKLISGTIAMLFYLRFLLKFLNQSLLTFLKSTLLRIALPILIQVLFFIVIIPYLPETKGKLNLLIVIGTGGVGSVLGFVTLYFSSKYYKTEFNHYLSKILKREVKLAV
jgi:O-antigen/teichoic acid export membrane protein